MPVSMTSNSGLVDTFVPSLPFQPSHTVTTITSRGLLRFRISHISRGVTIVRFQDCFLNSRMRRLAFVRYAAARIVSVPCLTRAYITRHTEQSHCQSSKIPAPFAGSGTAVHHFIVGPTRDQLPYKRRAYILRAAELNSLDGSRNAGGFSRDPRQLRTVALSEVRLRQ